MHLHQSERSVLLEGELTIVVNVPRRLRAGESLVLPPTTRHTIDNTGTVEVGLNDPRLVNVMSNLNGCEDSDD